MGAKPWVDPEPPFCDPDYNKTSKVPSSEYRTLRDPWHGRRALRKFKPSNCSGGGTADALALGASAREGVGVRVSPRALLRRRPAAPRPSEQPQRGSKAVAHRPHRCRRLCGSPAALRTAGELPAGPRQRACVADLARLTRHRDCSVLALIHEHRRREWALAGRSCSPACLWTAGRAGCERQIEHTGRALSPLLGGMGSRAVVQLPGPGGRRGRGQTPGSRVESDG